MAYCKKCKIEIEDGKEYCPDCEKNLDENDINMLERIFDDYINQDESDYDEDESGNELDIEELIQEGNKYSEEIKRQNEEQSREQVSMYDENGNYKPNNIEDVTTLLNDNMSDEDLLNFVDEYISGDMETDKNISYNILDEQNAVHNVQELYNGTSIIGSDDLYSEDMSMTDDQNSYSEDIGIADSQDSYSEDMKMSDMQETHSEDNDISNSQEDDLKDNNIVTEQEDNNATITSDNNDMLDDMDIAALLEAIDSDEKIKEQHRIEETETEVRATDDADILDMDNDSGYNNYSEDNQQLTEEEIAQLLMEREEYSSELNDEINLDEEEQDSDTLDLDNVNKNEYTTQNEQNTVHDAPKESFFKKIFANVEKTSEELDKERKKEAAARAKKQKKLVKDEDGNLVDKKVIEKKENKLKKEQKKEEKKRNKEEKRILKEQQRDLELAQELDNEKTKINKAGVAVVSVMSVAACCGIIILGNKLSYSSSIKACEKYYSQEQYRFAYLEINGMDLKDDDKHLYDELRTIMYVQSNIDDYESFMKINYYDKACNSLLTALSNYIKYDDDSKENDVDDVYKSMRKEILSELDKTFNISEDKALELVGIHDKVQYSQAVAQCTGDLYAKLEESKN